MNNADFEIMGEARFSCEIADEGCAESSNFVAVKEAEASGRIDVVIDQAVGIAIKGTRAIVRASFGGWGCSLFGFDKVGTTLKGFR